MSMLFNKKFFSEFWLLLKPYWVSEEKYSAYFYFLLQMLCIMGEVRANVAINHFSKNFYDALQNFDKTALVSSLWQFAIILIVLVVTVGYAAYFNGLLSIRWRRWLTKNYIQSWLNHKSYYRLQLSKTDLDNPDQRISEDLEKFPVLTLTIFFMLFHAALTLVTFGIILWDLSGKIILFHIAVPGYLLFSALIYACLGTLIISWVGRKLSQLNYHQQQYNANLRFSLVRFKESAEQVAFYRGEAEEARKFDQVFQTIYANFISMVLVNRRLLFFKNGYNTISFLFGLVIAIPLYLQKKIQLGGMMQISGAFSTVILAISVVIAKFEVFAEWRAVIHRLSEFNKVIFADKSSNISIHYHDQNDIVIKNLKLCLPNNNVLLENINMTFEKNRFYQLTHPSGTGKSTLLRAIAGIWPYGCGDIFLPRGHKTFFIPQKSYLPCGTLKELLLYPVTQDVPDDVLQNILSTCNLKKWSHLLHEARNWDKELSLGEQQLIAFARIFVVKPDILFLDEATSALDVKTESELYQNLVEFLPELTVVNVSKSAVVELSVLCCDMK